MPTAHKIIKKAVYKKLRRAENTREVEAMFYAKLRESEEIDLNREKLNFDIRKHLTFVPENKFSVKGNNCRCEYCLTMQHYIEAKKRKHRYKKMFIDENNPLYYHISLDEFNETIKEFDKKIYELKEQKNMLEKKLVPNKIYV